MVAKLCCNELIRNKKLRLALDLRYHSKRFTHFLENNSTLLVFNAKVQSYNLFVVEQSIEPAPHSWNPLSLFSFWTYPHCSNMVEPNVAIAWYRRAQLFDAGS